MKLWLLLPPIAFIVVLLVSYLLSFVSKKLAFSTGKKQAAGTTKSYACGEDVPCPSLQPDYSQFFPFAFFFTIMHVVALIVATVPGGSLKASIIAVFFIIAALSGLFILFRK